MATEKTSNYTPAQEKLILDAIEAAGGKANKALAERLAALSEMNDADGNPRAARSIIAKMTRMDGVVYERQEAKRKDGSAIESKADLVKQIADLSGATFTALGNAGRDDLVKLRDFMRKAA